MSDAPILHIQPSGDSALLVEARGGSREGRWAAVNELRARLTAHPFVGYLDLVSTSEHLFVSFDCGRTEFEAAKRWLEQLPLVAFPEIQQRSPRHFVIPVVFGGDHGPDLAEVAQHLGRREEAVIDELVGPDHVVRFVGAAMEPVASLGDRLGSIPRRRVPRPRVPAGSLSVASHDLAIYPFDSPGGWQLVGRTPVTICGIDRDPPAPYEPGDTFGLVRIGAEDWNDLAGARLSASER